MNDYAQLDAMIAAIRRVGVLPATVAKRAVDPVLAELRASAAAGTSPDGQAWAPKKDGGRALENASQAVAVKASGTVITASLVGTSTGDVKVQAIQHYGTKRIPARPILPMSGGGIPERIRAAILETAKKAFREAVTT